eukprot:TCONS_00014516-protein
MVKLFIKSIITFLLKAFCINNSNIGHLLTTSAWNIEFCSTEFIQKTVEFVNINYQMNKILKIKMIIIKTQNKIKQERTEKILKRTEKKRNKMEKIKMKKKQKKGDNKTKKRPWIKKKT